jgi:hypothetical protein
MNATERQVTYVVTETVVITKTFTMTADETACRDCLEDSAMRAAESLHELADVNAFFTFVRMEDTR